MKLFVFNLLLLPSSLSPPSCLFLCHSHRFLLFLVLAKHCIIAFALSAWSVNACVGILTLSCIDVRRRPVRYMLYYGANHVFSVISNESDSTYIWCEPVGRHTKLWCFCRYIAVSTTKNGGGSTRNEWQQNNGAKRENNMSNKWRMRNEMRDKK